ncbi:component of SufBCD complex [Paroceanicella profunda]|uniref:component of SufBCD complex n=1 Tax=Paroceanicella profunda TaxID=2579971 RepID=UPI00110A864E|nr:component of SufBCD complex [Paroceanicella profunda]
MGSGTGLPGSFLALIGTGTFDNVWYWGVTILAWSAACHWTVGVPHDLLMRADHRGGAAARQVDQLAAIHAARQAAAVRVAGPYLLAVAAFALSVVVTLAVHPGLELAQGVSFLALPLLLVKVLNVRLAIAIEAQAIRGEALRRGLARRRFYNQLIALLAITATALFGAAFLFGLRRW